VILDKDKMAENGIDPMGISQMIQANNSSSPSASFVNQDEEYLITTGKFLTSADDVENLVVGLNKNRPVYLRQVASVQDGPSTAKVMCLWLWKTNDNYKSAQSEYPAVTISVGKVKGADAMKISEKILKKVEHLKTTIIPNDVHVEITRNYGNGCG
jgi:multidrug efflux pump subunit AcrB